MTTQILRTIDRWRFEAPLALALGVSAAFFALTMPSALFDSVPVLGSLGIAGRVIMAVLLAVVSGGVGYVAMRRAGKPAPAVPVVDPVDEIAEEDRPSGMPAERLRRFRRADAHPDAPPREPIIASRDLGEPFMDVGGATPPPVVETPGDDAWWPDMSIPEADFTEVGDEPASPPIAAIADATVSQSVETDLATTEAAPRETETPAEWPLPRTGNSISAMMERLSSGLERRAAADPGDTPPVRDMQPALRDALDELNRLAARRD